MMTGRPCGQRGDVQRAADLEEFPLVPQVVHFVGIEIDCRVLVDRERVVIPTVPKSKHDLEEFAGALVAQGVWFQSLTAEVVAGGRVG
jgi:hypothetical protein